MDSCQFTMQIQCFVQKQMNVNSNIKQLTQSCIGPSFCVAGCVDQKHAGLMGHPGAEEQQEGTEYDSTLQEIRETSQHQKQEQITVG